MPQIKRWRLSAQQHKSLITICKKTITNLLNSGRRACVIIDKSNISYLVDSTCRSATNIHKARISDFINGTCYSTTIYKRCVSNLLRYSYRAVTLINKGLCLR